MASFERIDYEFGAFSYNYKYRTDASRYYHAHAGIELLYVYEGEGEVMLEGRHYPLRAGTLLWVQPYQLHLVDVPFRSGAGYARTNLTFDPHAPAVGLAPFPGLRRFYDRLWKGHLPQQAFALPADGPLPGILEDMRQALLGDAAEREEGFGLIMLRLLHYLQQGPFRESLLNANASPRSLQHIENITEWVERHFRRPFRLEEIAAELFLSPYHLSHLFKASTGMTLSDHIMLRRIREACSLLAATSKPIREIAAEVGGLSSSYFCQMFKRHKGVTPENYRRTVRDTRGSADTPPAGP
ncbi:AraC family transcriptional regulator [Paenibacillus glycinis]|uniref:Helix-turn-helix domain-containing protein n=1 Tax=Paenibacillus glycinis TaxID=2697035 RepID=A0ABW9XMK5_9BACL|nr:AraC family transcriptional regulator [Paenibacillus glycinis]NBD23869.1 helix-turn-helix domain-containing protein [Paenibacillus glycinis]